jgi:hypothetical protein
MTSSQEIEAIVRDAFEDVALLIGGATTLHHLDDDVVRTLIRRLDRVRSRALDRLGQGRVQATSVPLSARPYRLHPAVEGFLRRNVARPAATPADGPDGT